MTNPILKEMNRGLGAKSANPMLNGLAMVKNMARGNPDAFAQMLAQRNPQFARFMRENQGKSAEQIAQEYGIDPNALRDALK